MAIHVRDERALRKVVAVLLLLGALQGLNAHFRGEFWLNLTDSEPIGLYRVHQVDREIRRGEMIVMEVPSEFRPYVYGRGWLPEGWALFKHVGAVAGDVYCVVESWLIVNGKPVGPVYLVDEEGRPLPQLKGCKEIPEGYFLPVATRIPRSFDGRYMGPVHLALIQGVARPILTLE
uniref:Conjugal transfer protein TraF n=1 Tax=Geobacter sp. (strain M21) TaxID=443144 RepID=C6DZ96_GEOSM